MQNVWDLWAKGCDIRRGLDKAALFDAMRGRVLVVVIGTDHEVRYFRPGLHVTGIDFSEAMLKRDSQSPASGLDIVLSSRRFKPLRAAAGNGIAEFLESVASGTVVRCSARQANRPGGNE